MTALLSMLLLLAALLAPGDIVRMKDGSLVHGSIEEFDEGTGFALRRADNGGLVRLRWEHLAPGEARRIKEARGFTGEAPEPYLVNVVHLVLVNGTSESGILVDDGRRDAYTLRRRGGLASFPRNYVRSVEPGRAEGLAVYEPEQLYGVVLHDLGPPGDAPSHFGLALACEGAGLYERAREHYRAARDQDPEFRPELTQLRLERLGIKIEDAAETALLVGIRNRLYRNQFDQALAEAAAFREAYPMSRQRGELERLEGEIRSRRRSHFGTRIISDYFSHLGRTLSSLARNDAMTMGAAMELLESSVHDEILDRLSERYGLDSATVQELWEARRGGSLRTSSYGTGTFVLGEERALDWELEDDEPADPEQDSVAEDDDLQARIEKVLRKRQEERRQRQASARSKRRLDDGLTPDEWWERSPSDVRARWLTAYYAEFSGHVSVVRAKPRPCRTCSASGTITVESEEGELEQVTCPTCKALKVERLVSFR